IGVSSCVGAEIVVGHDPQDGAEATLAAHVPVHETVRRCRQELVGPAVELEERRERRLEGAVLGRSPEELAAELERELPRQADTPDEMKVVGAAVGGIRAEIHLLRILSLEENTVLLEKRSTAR